MNEFLDYVAGMIILFATVFVLGSTIIELIRNVEFRIVCSTVAIASLVVWALIRLSS